MNPKAISERLGHRNVGFTMATYIRTGEGEQRAIAETMGALGVQPEQPEQSGAVGPETPLTEFGRVAPGEAVGESDSSSETDIVPKPIDRLRLWVRFASRGSAVRVC